MVARYLRHQAVRAEVARVGKNLSPLHDDLLEDFTIVYVVEVSLQCDRDRPRDGRVRRDNHALANLRRQL